MTGHHPDRDVLVAYSLGALEPPEAREVEAHAPGCARCSRELEALAPAVGVLGESVEQLEPPIELRERVMAAVRADVETPTEARAPGRRRGGWRGLMTRPAIAVGLAIAVAAIGGYLIAGNGEGGGTQQTTVPVVAEQGIGGTLAVGEDSSTLALHGLAQLKGRDVYQVWIAEGKSLHPSSDFVPDAKGEATTAVGGQLTAGTKVMVTREPGPGRRMPTPPVLLSATVR